MPGAPARQVREDFASSATMAVAELNRGHQGSRGHDGSHTTQVFPLADGPMSSARESLSRLEQCCAATGGDESRFAAILARVKKHVKEAEQLAMMHTMASQALHSSPLDNSFQETTLGNLLQAAQVTEEMLYLRDGSKLHSAESRSCERIGERCATPIDDATNASRNATECMRRSDRTFSFAGDFEHDDVGTCERHSQQVPQTETRATHESTRVEPLARPDLSLKDLANIAARRDDLAEDKLSYQQISRIVDEDDSVAKQEETVLLEDAASEGLNKTMCVTVDTGTHECERMMGEGITFSSKDSFKSPLQTDVCSSTADTARSPRSCVTEAPTRPDDVLAALLAQAYRNSESASNSPVQAIQMGSRVQALYQGSWYVGTVVGLREHDERCQGRYAVQCDSDQQGILLYTTDVQLAVLPESPTAQMFVEHTSSSHDSPTAPHRRHTERSVDQIALLEQRLEDLERQMAYDVQEVASLTTLNRHYSAPTLPSPVLAPAVLQPPVMPSLSSPERTAVHRKVETRTPVRSEGTARKVGDAVYTGSSSATLTPSVHRGEAAREAAARDLAAMKEAAATLAASAAACKASVSSPLSSPLLPEFSEELPPKRDLDLAPMTAWAEDAYSQVVGVGSLAARRMRRTPVVQSHPVVAKPDLSKQDLSSFAHELAESVSTAISSSPALKSASSWRCVASSPESGSFGVSCPTSPVACVSQRRPAAQGDSIASTASPPMLSCRLVSSSCPEHLEAKEAGLLERLFAKTTEEWDESDVCSWMGSFAPMPKDLMEFIEAHAINGLVLLSLTDEDLETLPLRKFGHRRLLLLAAKQLRSLSKSEALRPFDAKWATSESPTKSGHALTPELGVAQVPSSVGIHTDPVLRGSSMRHASPLSPSRATPSRGLEATRDVVSRKGLFASPSAQTLDSFLDVTSKNVSATISLASPNPPSPQRTPQLSRTNSSPSALLCNHLLQGPRRCSPERAPSSPLLQRAASPDGRSASPVRQSSRALGSSRPISTSGTQPVPSQVDSTGRRPFVADSIPTTSGSTRGSLRMSASSRRLGTSVTRQSRPRSPLGARTGPARHTPSTTACKRGGPVTTLSSDGPASPLRSMASRA